MSGIIAINPSDNCVDRLMLHLVNPDEVYLISV
jgi:hypothetical protein